jgi:hypothetical protein
VHHGRRRADGNRISAEAGPWSNPVHQRLAADADLDTLSQVDVALFMLAPRRS